MAISDSPIKKCPGVRYDKSNGSVESGVIGLEFKHASIHIKIVFNSS